MRRVTLLGSCLLLLAVIAQAGTNSPQRTQAFAKLPDWTGLWEPPLAAAVGNPQGKPAIAPGSNEFVEMAKRVKLMEPPPYNREWQQKSQAAMRNVAAQVAAEEGTKNCDAEGFPFLMDFVAVFQVVVTPEETLFLFDTGGVRHIYTDGRSHPDADDIWPTPMGDSIGHWEGTTLVIDTIERTPGPVTVGFSADLSERAHFTERVRMLGKDALEDLLTIEDPLRFTRPWQLSLHYTRVPDLNRMIGKNCQHDRNPVVNGKLTIAVP